VWATTVVLATTLAHGVATLVLSWRLLAQRRRVKALQRERAGRDAAAAEAVRRAEAAARGLRRERDEATLRAEEAEARWSALWKAAPLATLDDAGRVVDLSPAAASLRRPLAGRTLASGTMELPRGKVVRVARAGDVALLLDAAPEREAEEERSEIAALEDTSFEGIALVRNDRIVECNGAFARLCGKLPHQIAGTPLREWIAPEMGRANALRAADGRSTPVEAIARTTPGGTRVVHVRATQRPSF